MLKYLFASLLATIFLTVSAQQNVGIGTIIPNAKLEISASNPGTPTNQDGILIPRVNAFPVANPGINQNSMMVYLTTTVGANLPGFYYWNDGTTSWKPVGDGKFWELTGNAGTIAGTHFLGTTDNIPFSIRVNNAPGARIDHIRLNTFLGSGAGNINTTGERNIAIGSKAFSSNSNGEKNTVVGVQAMQLNQTGSNNTVYGYDAMFFNQAGERNTAVGVNALYRNLSASNNTAIGLNALYFKETGVQNTAIGLDAGKNNVAGNGNVFVGYKAGEDETGSNKLYISNNFGDANNALIYGEFDNKLLRVNGNMGIGVTSAPNAKLEITATNAATPTNQDGILIPRVDAFPAVNPGINQNGMMVYLTTTVALNLPGFYFWDNGTTSWKTVGEGKFWGLAGNTGTIAGTHFLGTTDNTPFSIRVNNAPGARIDHIKLNTFLGSGAGNVNTTGERNIAIGSKAFSSNSNGEKNTVAGVQAMENNLSGSNNTVIGYDAMSNNASGQRNTAIGVNALLRNLSGSDNTAIGLNALYYKETGEQNTAIGHEAGKNNVAGNGNVFIGFQAGFNETGSNKLYISNKFGDANNALIYGEFDNQLLRVNTNMGIGKTPAHKLDVLGSVNATSFLGDGSTLSNIVNTTAAQTVGGVKTFSSDLVVNGRIGIGLASAIFPLEIKSIFNDLIKFYDNTGTAKWHMNLSSGVLSFTETNVAGNRLVLNPGGEVGIGKQPLTTANDSRLQVKQKGTQNGLGIENANTTDHWDFYVTGAPSDMQLYLNGTHKGTFSNVNGAYALASDSRVKKDITPQTPVISGLMQLQAYQYHYLDNKPTDNFSNGFMAQDVQKIFPDAVVENEMKNGEKRLGINYQYFTVLAVKGFQEQQKIIDSQEGRLKKLEAQVAILLEKK
jgi:hypothetical protein